MINDKMKESPENKIGKNVHVQTMEVLPQEARNPNVLTLDEYIEVDENINLPEVPSNVLEPKEDNLDKEIESRLTKLKFFNKTWLNNVSTT